MMDTISVEMTGNKSDQFGNAKLMSYGLTKQSFNITKSGEVLKLNMFGMTIGTFTKFEELYKFLLRTKTTVMNVSENLGTVMKAETYIKTL